MFFFLNIVESEENALKGFNLLPYDKISTKI